MSDPVVSVPPLDARAAIEQVFVKGVEPAGLRLSELAGAAALLNAESKQKEAAAKELRAMRDRLEAELQQRMADENVPQLRVDHELGSTTVHLQACVYASCPPEQKPALLTWLREHGQAALVKEDVNAATLQAHVKELERGGEEVPPMVKVSHVDEVRYLTVAKS